MKRPISKRILRALLIFLLTIIGLVIIINIPIITLSHKSSKTDYSNWMADTLENNQLIVDTAMLGAHDAFTNEIDILSKLDPYETNSIMQGATGVLVKGFITKQAITQISDADTLLKAGVRYLDIRLSYTEGQWITKHNYLSGDFEPITVQLTTFLEDNPGEFLILDFQHVSGVEYSSLDDYNLFIQMLDNYGLLDYAHIVNDLSTLTYGDITSNGTESRIIIISKFDNSNIRSSWADSDDFDYVINFLEEEADFVETESIYGKLRVMQAVTTMQMSGSGIANALSSWSLINRAKKFNAYLLEYEHFETFLNELPII